MWTYTYDTDNRLKTANKTGLAATLAYDAEGRLRQTVIAGGTTNLAYDGVDLVAEYDGAGTLLRRYVHGPGVDEPLVWYEGTGTTNKSWLYADHLGSVVATANSAGTSTATYTYGPYGEPNVTTGSRFRYTGQQLIGQLNLYYYKARFYSPAIGRFLQTDPIGYADDMNLYAYVGNDPVNLTDPTGEFWVQVAGGVFNAAVGAAVRYNTGGGSAWHYARDAAIDFGVGAFSSGAAGVQKFATLQKGLNASNATGAKFVTAATAEVGKAYADNNLGRGTASTATVAGVLNATGVVGKGANWVAREIGAIKDGFRPDPKVAALLQRPAVVPTSPALAAGITGSLGALPDYAAGLANSWLGEAVGRAGTGGAGSVGGAAGFSVGTGSGK